MSLIRCGSFAWGEKVMKIREAEEERQISKLVSESRDHSKHRPMLQFETLLRRPALLRQQYSISSLKFFIWNFVTGDVPHELSDDQKRTRIQLAVSLQAELERAQRRNWTEFDTGNESRILWNNFAKGFWLSLDEELSELVRQTIGAEKSVLTVFPIRMVSLLWIFCHKRIISLHNTSLIKY
jgi:hypothetical protein